MIAAIGFVKTVVLVRIISPEEFGLAAIATAVASLLQTFSDAGVGAAIVQREHVTQRQLSTLFWIAVGLSVAMGLMLVALGRPISGFYRQPALRPLLLVSASALVVSALGQQYQMLLLRQLKFGTLAITDMAAAGANGMAAIVAALMGFGAISIVIGQFAGSCLRSAMYLVNGWSGFRPDLDWRLSDVSGFMSFGLYTTGQRIVSELATRVDQLLIGRLLGPVQLGYYSLAYNLVLQPIARVAPIVGRVALPVYSLMQQDTERLSRAYYRVLHALSTLLLPVMVFLMLFAHPVVAVVYGARWAPSVALVQILAVAAVFWTVDAPVGTLQVSLNKVGLAFAWFCFVLAVTAAAVVFGAQWEVRGVALGIVAAWAVLYVTQYFAVVRPLIGPGTRHYFVAAMGLPLGLSFIAGVVALGASLLTQRPVLQVAIGGAMFALAYGALTWRFSPGLLRDLMAGLVGVPKKRELA